MIRAAVLLLCALLPAAPAWAAEDGDDAVRKLIFHALNLGLMLAVLLYFARKPVRNFFLDRRERVRGELNRATTLLDEAQARFSIWQRRLAEVDSELEEIRATGRRRAERESEQILADARSRAERIRSEANAAIEQELRRAREELREEAANLSVKLAVELLIQELSDADHDRLMAEFTERIERESDARGAPARQA